MKLLKEKRKERRRKMLFEDYKMKRKLKKELREKASNIFIYLTEYFYLAKQPKISKTQVSSWIDSIYSELHMIDLLPVAQKYPDAEFILNNTYDLYMDIAVLRKKIVLAVFDEYGFQIREAADEEFSRFCLDYFERVADILSQEGCIYKSELKNILEVIS